MSHIFVLIGGASSGKTTIAKNLSESRYSKINNFLLARWKGSSQEDAKVFCDYEKVITIIKNAIRYAENEAGRRKLDNYALLIPFTLQVKDGKLGDDCIIKPLEYLKSLSGYNIYIIYLKRERKQLIRVNEFIEKNIDFKLQLNSNMQDNQAENTKKLMDFIINSFRENEK